MKFIAVAVMGIAAVFLLHGCGDNPSEPTQEERLSYTLSTDVSNPETLADTELELVVTNERGDRVTDFSALQLEHRMAGGTDWNAMPMHWEDGAYRGHHTFWSSGNHEIRVMGEERHFEHMHHPGQDSTCSGEMYQLHRFHGPLYVHRAHRETADYWIEFECFPGQVHAGEPAMLRFWVKDRLADPMMRGGSAITGLHAEIRCTEADGSGYGLPADEVAAGVYQARHMVRFAGMTRASLEFTDPGGKRVRAEFQMQVSAAD